MEGAGKGSECIKTLRMRGSVPVHRNLKCINAWRWGGGGGGKVSENIEIISSKLQDMEGAGKGSECGKVRVHRNIKSKSVAKTWRGG